LLSAGAAHADKPDGSRAEVMLESGNEASGDPSHQITAGWWGHEGGLPGTGPTGAGTTYPSLDAADDAGHVSAASVAALVTAMGATQGADINFAIVPFSADGSNEHPSVTVAPENAAKVFDTGGSGRILYANWGTGLGGNTNPNDFVAVASTLAEVTDWVNAGQPAQIFDNNLQMKDAETDTLSATPQGKSILNAWPAGTALSLVAYAADPEQGFDPSLGGVVPFVKRGADGKAETAWMPFTTVQSPTSALRTSAGYQVGTKVDTNVTTTATFSGSAGTVTATVKKVNGTTASDATGTVTFALVTGSSVGTPTPEPVTNGVATFPVDIAPGQVKVYSVQYVAAAGETHYLSSVAANKTITNGTVTPPPAAVATTTAFAVTAGTTPGSATLKATVSPATAAGTVSFTDGATALGQASVSGGSATLAAKLTAGQHAVKAVFTPSDATKFTASTSAVSTVWTPDITTKLKPSKAVVGKAAKLTVTLDTPGTTAAGQLVVTIKPPKGGKAKTVTVALKGGKATIKLAKLVKGKTKVTIVYAGSGSVLAATASASVKAAPAKKKK
jgi:hypothetical protein